MSTVLTREENGFFHVVLNRPERHNAFDAAMISAITRAFQTAAASAARAVIVSAEGKSFCSGADLEYMKSMASFSVDENRADAERLYDMFEAALKCPLPTLARVHGNVMGGGLGLVAACDVVTAESSAVFCFSEVRLGLVPAVISPFILRKVARGLAHEWMLTGRRFTAEEALKGGLISHHGDAAAVDGFARAVQASWTESGPEALRETKSLLTRVPTLAASDLRAATATVIAQRRVSTEGQEGLKAFFEKRQPRWKPI